MGAILSVIAVVLISLLINRFATVALSLTGMSREEARFQARAAMSGVGLTTSRADDIVGHPIRRRIVLWLMIVWASIVAAAPISECPGPRRSLHRGTRSCYMGARRGSASSTSAGEAHAVTPLTRRLRKSRPASSAATRHHAAGSRLRLSPAEAA
jgi:hypothetical protein